MEYLQNIDLDENDSAEKTRIFYQVLSEHSPAEIARYFCTGSFGGQEKSGLTEIEFELRKMNIRNYVRQQPEAFRKRFSKCLDSMIQENLAKEEFPC